MSILLVVLLVLTVGAVAAVAVGVVRGGLPQATSSLAPPLDGGVHRPADLDDARFAVSFRGYRMDQVDDVLDDARDALAARDAEIERLRRELAGLGQDPSADPAEVQSDGATGGPPRTVVDGWSQNSAEGPPDAGTARWPGTEPHR